MKTKNDLLNILLNRFNAKTATTVVPIKGEDNKFFVFSTLNFCTLRTHR